MAGTITASVRGRKKVLAGALFLIANVGAGASVGVAAALAGRALPDRLLIAALALAATSYLTYFVVRGRVPFIRWPRQLPPTWRNHRRPLLTALRYGTVFGLAFSTPIRSGSLVVLALLVASSGSPSLGATLFALVGLMKALPTATEPFRISPEDRRENLQSSYAWQRPLVTLLDALLLALLLGALAGQVAE